MPKIKPAVPATLYRVTAGDKNAADRVAAADRLRAASSGRVELAPGEADALAKRLEFQPEHVFYVVAKGGLGEFPKAMAAAWERLGAKSSDDLPKPFNMERVDDVLLAV